MLSHKIFCCLTHSIKIRFFKCMITISSIKYICYIRRIKSVLIHSCLCIQLAVKSFIYSLNAKNCYISWQVSVKIISQLIIFLSCIKLKISRLFKSMNSFFCSASTIYVNLFTCHPANYILNLSLYCIRRTVPAKTLPSIISSTIIL